MMKQHQTTISKWLSVTGIVAAILLTCQVALAADSVPGWRGTYDLALRWLNFLILVGVIVKYSRVPVKNFLRMRREDVKREITVMEDEKRQLIEKLNETLQYGKEQDFRLKRMKDNIIADGERRKLAMIEDARRQSEYLMKEAKRRVRNRMLQAKKEIKDELVDLAVEMASRQIRRELDEKDNQQLVHSFLASI